MKIYLSPSDQNDNKYAYGDYTEAQICRKIAESAKKHIDRQPNMSAKLAGKNLSIAERVAESNEWDADVHMPIHTNAGGGDGTLVLCWKGNRKNKYVVAIYKSVSNLTPTKDDGIRENTSLYEIKKSAGVCVYLEAEFHDNSTYAKWIVNHIDDIGEAIAKGLCTAAGVKYVAQSSSSSSTSSAKKLYRVQVGAYKHINNAEKIGADLKKDGYSVYIYPANGQYKVQCGAYTSKKNADTLADKLEKDGYNTYVYLG